MTSTPASLSFEATLSGVSPNNVRSSRVKVMEAITGRLQTSRTAVAPSHISCRSLMVSSMIKSTPASARTEICSLKTWRACSGWTRPKGAKRTPNGPTSPATKTGLKEARTTRRASSTPARLISATLSSRPCSVNLKRLAPNVFVRMTWAPD